MPTRFGKKSACMSTLILPCSGRYRAIYQQQRPLIEWPLLFSELADC
jgi:hypothetical protein